MNYQWYFDLYERERLEFLREYDHWSMQFQELGERQAVEIYDCYKNEILERVLISYLKKTKSIMVYALQDKGNEFTMRTIFN